ncbi:MAG: bifunctional oligoribonuclease/PAP phosphatase NrnA [Muribaculaceae bacterium]|nr:bifunctional oligoribonuclease/PAP phosphatase NrnA [Muribaculaceae bacterium]
MDKLIDTKKAKELRRNIERSDKIVLTCHVRPDGDAIGSTLGLWHLLKELGKQPTVIVPDKPPMNLSFLPGFKEIGINTLHPQFCEKSFEEADMVICCDFNTPSRQDNLAQVMLNSPGMKVLIDHHQEPSAFTDIEFSYPDMSSTCELVFRLIAAMGWYGEVNLDCATSLLTGIITDTRNFSVNCKNPDLYDILMRLLEKGVDKERIIKEALTTRSLASLKLEAYAISEKLEIFQRNKGALITLSKEELDRFNYEKGDTEGLVNRPLEVKGIVYSIFMREDADCIKVSARSCNGFPVSEICKNLYGGGGHLQAAGGEFHGSLEECRKILIENMDAYNKYLRSTKSSIV